MEKEFAREAYRRMCNIREFDMLVHDYADRDYRVMALMHSAIGAEAYSVAAMMNVKPEDYMATTYRNHAHTIAKNIDLKALAAELCGKRDGVCHGMAGNMHAVDQELNIIGGFGIIGAGLPSCLGTAFAAKYKKTDSITIAFLGDGAVAQGAFHESMNLAAVWKLPVLFINDNNRYAMSTATCANLVTEDIAEYARAYKMPAVSVDGMDFFASDAVMKEAIAYVRSGKGPYFVECKAYRYHGQFEGDLQLYKPQEEIEAYWRKDPISNFEQQVQSMGLLSQDEMTAIRNSCKEQVVAAFDYAEQCEYPDLSAVYENVYSDQY